MPDLEGMRGGRANSMSKALEVENRWRVFEGDYKRSKGSCAGCKCLSVGFILRVMRTGRF